MILNEILKNTSIKVYCLVRGNEDKFIQKRLDDLYKKDNQERFLIYELSYY